MRLVAALWRARWNIARLSVALVVVWALAVDTPARLARASLARLPDFDFLAEVQFLRSAGRYGEAIVIADEGLRVLNGPARDTLASARTAVVDEQASWTRRLTDAGRGAITGRGDSLESLVGAVAADFFVVGDVRDIVIQSARLVVDGETDELLLALSGVGIATTLAPQIDWVPAVAKAARKTGTLTKGLADELLTLIRAGRSSAAPLTQAMENVATLAKRASPGGAMRALRHANSTDDAAALARFVERQPSGAFALHVLGDQAAAAAKATAETTVKVTAKSTARSAARAALAGEDAVIAAARKGPAGAAWLRTAGRAAFRPHPILGVLKSVYKGNAQSLAARVAAAVDPRAMWLLPLVCGWAFFELGLLVRRVWIGTRPAGA